MVIANFKTGYENDREPFLIDNDAFPVLNNMYVWRGRLKKKRGTSLLGRLRRSVTATGLSSASPMTFNLYTFLGITQTNPNIASGTISITLGAETFTDNGNGTLTGSLGGSGIVNYITGAITITTGQAALSALTVTLEYFPDLPVMGLEDFKRKRDAFPNLVAFDTRYSYQFNQTTLKFYDVTFYKGSGAPFTWTGTDFQQFWSTNYQEALWVTNGSAGFNFATIIAFADLAAATNATVTLDNPNLLVGDRLFFNEVQGVVVTNLNGISGTITNNAGAPVYQVTLDSAATLTTFASGIVQLLTNSRANTGNGIKFYDGDPTTSINLGWVNFAPPLSNALIPQYLIGADAVLPFKNRLLFFGPTIATSAAPGGIYFPNRIVYSENGTPYYNSLVPADQVFEVRAWFQNVAGFGGFIAAPIPYRLVTVNENEDVLLTGFENKQLKLLFTGDDTLPFVFQTINSELGSASTFSGVSLDTGALTMGDYGIALTTQVSAQRIDLVIPDQIFDISGVNNADRRVTAIRDYRNEFIYFTYSPKNRTNSANTRQNNIFNSKTLLYNYRDNTWATFDENYTHYGTFRRTSNITWATLNQRYKTWNSWNDAWNFGSTGARYPSIIGGNQQGFVMIKDDGTYEDNSQYIESIDTTTFIVTSPNHCLNNDDFIEVSESIGITNFNSQIFKVFILSTDTFQLLLNDTQMTNPPTGTYLGGGVYRRMVNIFVQTKQFQIYWNRARKTRLGTQRFMIENAPNDDDGDPPSQITLNLYTSQNIDYPSNLPEFGYFPYSNILLTGPEPEQPFQVDQNQIWHRSSNSVIGDTVQLGFVLSDDQMRVNVINQAEIIIHAIAIDLYPGPTLA